MKASLLIVLFILPVFSFSQDSTQGYDLKMNVPANLMMEVFRFDPQNAIRLYNSSCSIFEEQGEQQAMSWSMDQLGEIYFTQKNYNKSLQYFSKALEIHQQLNKKPSIANTLRFIGNIMEEQKEYNSALNYYFKSKKLVSEINDQIGLGNISVNIGHVYFKLQNFPKALQNYEAGLTALREANQPKGIAIATCNLGEYYIQQNNNHQAVNYLEESYRISEELGFPELIKHSSHLLSLAYEKSGDGLLSVKLYKRYAFMKDSIENDMNRKIAIRKEVQFEVEKDRMAKEQTEKEKTKQEKDRIGRRNGLQLSIIFISILFVLGITALLGFVKISPYLAEGFIFVSVLILFEFILVLTDPFVDGITNGIPVYKLFMNTLLAVLVFPLHSVFERKLKKRLKK